MMSFKMVRSGGAPNIVTVVELSFREVMWLLLGRELHLPRMVDQVAVLRQPTSYAAFNLAAGQNSERGR